MVASNRLAWLADVTDDDLALVGIDKPEAGQRASVALAGWAGEYDVDLERVHECLSFLQSGPHMLLAPSPLALLTYSPRLRTFRASFDLDFPDDLRDAGFARAGAWLTVLSSEVGELPTHAGHWLSASVGNEGLEGPNVGVVAWAQMYASLLVHRGIADQLGDTTLSNYDRRMCGALWRCAAYALR